MSNELPVLEEMCTECGGAGMVRPRMIGRTTHDGGLCQPCRGAGYIPTAAGEAIIRLIQHATKAGQFRY
ncbi:MULTISPECIES: hypothetical protein [unclassified Sphingomonas]|uniref:hypothetical protein n=1 Tax=unclassified Sphingomonas TaxID=196159 RepID=UPI0009E6DF7D